MAVVKKYHLVNLNFYLKKGRNKKTVRERDVTLFCDRYFNLNASMKHGPHYGLTFHCAFCYGVAYLRPAKYLMCNSCTDKK